MQKIENIINNLLFLPLDVPPAPDYVVQQLEDMPLEDLYFDKYRNTYIAAFMSGQNLEWWPAAYEYPDIKKYIEEAIFPFTGVTRATVLISPPEQFITPHIDSNRKSFDIKLEHKFRYVLQGNVSDLEFLTDQSAVSPPEVDRAFIMSGKWPHQMTNTYHKKKITFTVGSPWDPKITDQKYVEQIKQAYDKYGEYYVSNEGLSLPSNYEDYFQH